MNARCLLPITAAFVKLHAATLALLTLALAFGPGAGLQAADATFTNTAAAYWTTLSSWDPNVLPTSADNAIVGAGAVQAFIEFGATAAYAGRVTLRADRTINQVLRAQNSSASLTVYGIDGVLINNLSTRQFQFGQNGGTRLTLKLAGSGTIGGATATSTNLIYSPITEVGGSYGFTKVGPNPMILWSNCTHSGGTTITEGAIRVADKGVTLGSGPINLAGGKLICGADRSGVSPLPNAVVLSADTTITSDSAAAAARNMYFSGGFSGTAGTLTIDNNGTGAHVGYPFVVRLSGGFNFTRPVVVKSAGSTTGTFVILRLYQAAADGTQTFGGNISGAGSVERSGGDGTTIFSGANSYSGGTTISAGTLLANNSSGSGTGSGAVTVQSPGVLGGTGTIAGTVTVQSGGTLAPGSGGIGTLTLNATPALGGNLVMEIDRAASPNADKLVINGAALASGGALTVNNVGAALTGGETFDLFDASAISGLFTATNLPALGADLNWWTGRLGTDGTLKVNGAPTAATLSYSRAKGVSLKIHKADITAALGDPDSGDGDSASFDALTSTGGQGATVTEYATFILYQPVNDNNDTLQYRAKDTRGGVATGSIQINVVPDAGQASPEIQVSGGTATVSFAGIPGISYVVQRSTDMLAWKNIRTNTAPANGLWSVTDDFSDLSGPPASAYYRLQRP